MTAMVQDPGKEEVHLDKSSKKTIDFLLGNLLIQIVWHRDVCGCLALKIVTPCQENRNWSSGLPGRPGNEEPQQYHPEAKCNN